MTYQGSHVTTLLSSLNRDRKEEDCFCDVILVVDGDKFPVHKCVLASVSLFFRKMFKTNMKEKYDKSPSIHGVNSETMRIILDFIYGAEIVVTDDNAMKLLEGSDYLQIDELKYFCGMFYRQQLNAHNCLQLYELGQMFTCGSLCQNAADAAAVSLDEVAKEDAYKELAKDSLLVIIRTSAQLDRNESACKAVFIWAEYDCDGRKNYLVELLKLLDITLLRTEFIERILDHEVLLNDSHECKNLFMSELLNRLKLEKVEKEEQEAEAAEEEEVEAAEEEEVGEEEVGGEEEEVRGEEAQEDFDDLFRIHDFIDVLIEDDYGGGGQDGGGEDLRHQQMPQHHQNNLHQHPRRYNPRHQFVGIPRHRPPHHPHHPHHPPHHHPTHLPHGFRHDFPHHFRPRHFFNHGPRGRPRPNPRPHPRQNMFH